MANIDAACAAIGRDPASLGRTAAIRIDLPGRAQPHGEAVSPITGSVDEIAATIARYGELGIAHLNIWLEPNTVAGVLPPPMREMVIDRASAATPARYPWMISRNRAETAIGSSCCQTLRP